jgi:UDP-N-acetylmuramoylalanine--D-glutamate ligase
VRTVTSLKEAVRAARGFAQPGDVILLSPACASYDQFINYEQRGEAFVELVNRGD